MIELPLFPLNTVLFPGMLINLHIFEERYKRMIRLCLDRKIPFGVVLIHRGTEALGPLPEPYPIGCMAKIEETQVLSGGRMNITALGQERFRVHALDQDAAPYLVGQVEPYPILVTDHLALARAARKFQPLVAHYLELISLSGKSPGGQTPKALQSDPASLLYTAAVSLQVPPVVKQEILSVENAEDMLRRMASIYRREIAFIKLMLARGASGEEKTFSKN